MQTIWKGTLSFGLVNIPASLVATTRRSRISFRQLHAKDRAPIKQERHCTACGETVASSDLVKGVEVDEDTFVVVTEEELDEVEPESSRVLEVKEFVTATDVDPLLVDRSYALAPLPGGERAYVLLHDALSRRNEVAIGRVTLRNREYVVAVRAGDRLLFADVMHYPEEVRNLAEVEERVVRAGEVSSEEAELADVLMDRLHKEWEPGKYEDRYERRLQELVEAKARGEDVSHAPAPRKKAATKDLLAALRETLQQQESAGEGQEAEAA